MKRGLCLAGGGSTGAYEVGALRCLYEHGYEFDVIVGTSIGALNGAMLAQGSTLDELQALWLEITPEKVMKGGINLNSKTITEFDIHKTSRFLTSYLTNAGADITPFKELCAKYISPKRIKESTIEFGCVCCSLPFLKEVRVNAKEIEEKDILPFIHASSACAPVFPIEKINGKRYVDGFYKNNLPIDYCFSLGANEIVAIDLKLFGLEPPNKELLRLPNVLAIEPRRSLGSFMDFTPSSIAANMRRGYLDAKKALGLALGKAYCFPKSEQLLDRGKEFAHRIVNLEESLGKKVARHLLSIADMDGITKLGYADLLVVCLERMAELAKLDDCLEYTPESLFQHSLSAFLKEDGEKRYLLGRKSRLEVSDIRFRFLSEEDNAILSLLSSIYPESSAALLPGAKDEA